MSSSLSKNEIKSIGRIAGAYIASVIGSGFSTGQEVLQFFSSYAYKSYGVVAIELIGFLLLGYFLMRIGYENRNNGEFDHFRFFCGKKLGAAYSWLITATLLMLIPVLISGGGATLNEYFRIPKPLGSAVLTLTVLAVYLIGFEKMVGVISKLGPLIILFSLSVGMISLVMSKTNWTMIPDYEAALKPYRAAPTWWLSGFLYLGLNFFPGSTYFTQLGASANTKKELKYGSVCGALSILLSITIMSTAILMNGDAAAGLDIPVLYLARRISNSFGAVFAVILILGIFSASSVAMWSACRNLITKTHKNTLTAVSVAAFGYIVSLFSFGSLIGTIYPLIGYVSLIFLGCVIGKGFAGRSKR